MLFRSKRKAGARADESQGDGYDEVTGGLTAKAFAKRIGELIETVDQRPSKPSFAIVAITSSEPRRVFRAPRMIDAVFRKISTELENYSQRRVLTGRIQQDQLGIVFTEVAVDDAMALLRDLCLQLKVLIKKKFADAVPDDISFSIGVCQVVHSNLSFDEYIDLIHAVATDVEGDADAAMLTGGDGDDAPLEDSPELDMVLRAMNEGWLRLASQKVAPIDKPFERTTMMELLLRIAVPNGPIMISGQFMKTAEAHGLIVDLDKWVVEQACKWLAGGRTNGSSAIGTIERVFVNLSLASIKERKTVRHIDSMCEEYGISGDKFCFEVDEADALEDVDSFRKVVSRLRQIGCTFSLDNVSQVDMRFATLNRLPVDYVKLDGSVVMAALEDEKTLASLQSLVKTCASAGKRVIAQRVEDVKTIPVLRDAGIACVQGFGIEAPQSVDVPD